MSQERAFVAGFDPLAGEIADLLEQDPPSGFSRWMVAIVGIPASGKTRAAKLICDRANTLYARRHALPASDDAKDGGAQSAHPRAVVVPMDGYHLTRAELDKMPDPALAHARRGAHWTFNVDGLGSALRAVATQQGETALNGWDHALKDPSYGAVTVGASDRVVIVEGLYLLLNDDAWPEHVGALFHRRWLIECSEEVSKQRGAVRNFEAGISPTLAQSVARWEANDEPNGRLLLAKLDRSKLDAVVTGEEAYLSALPDASSEAVS